MTVYQTILDLSTNPDELTTSLAFSIHPSEVRTTTKIGKGKLELFPVTDFKGMSLKRSPQSVEVASKVGSVFLVEPCRPRSAESDKWRPDVVLVPFWWVSSTSNKDDANMQEMKHIDKASGLTFPVWSNSRPLGAHEKLLMFKPKKEVVPLFSAAVSKAKKQRST